MQKWRKIHHIYYTIKLRISQGFWYNNFFYFMNYIHKYEYEKASIIVIMQFLIKLSKKQMMSKNEAQIC